jgi:hypothetical protein
MSETDPQFYSAWRSGKLVIIGTIGEGPDAGGAVICVTPRADFLSHCDRARISLAKYPGFLHRVRGAIRREILRGVSRLTPQNDKNLMDDLAIMMAVKLAMGESAINESGLFSLMLAIDNDGSRPWDERGFMASEDVITASVIVR